MAEIIGTAGDDRGASQLVGTPQADVIAGLAGDDVLIGLGGDDRLGGGSGNDALSGGDGRDTLDGGSGNDTLVSGEESDVVRGGAGNDSIVLTGMTTGRGGRIQPGLGADTIVGSVDLWNSGEAHDLDYGDVGDVGGLTITVGLDGTGTAVSGDGRVNDVFSYSHFFAGTAGADSFVSLDEEPGTDRFEAWRGGAGDDTINGGAFGFDQVRYNDERDPDETQAVTVDLSTGRAIDTFGDTDVLISIEGVIGTYLGDTFIGSATQASASFKGLDGADTIRGAELSGNATDGFLGFESSDYDRDADMGGTAGVRVDLQAGTAIDGFGQTDRLFDVDGVLGTRFADRISGSETANILRGAGGNDTLAGMGGDDTLRGGEGDDALGGGDGDDLLDGEAGADALRGGDGNDLYIVDDLGDDVLDTGGFDTVETSVTFRVRQSGVERVEATGEGDIRIDGAGRTETLVGNDGSNILIGGGAIDRVTGGLGADSFVIYGGGNRAGLVVEDFSTDEGDRLAIDDQFLGFGRQRIEVRSLDVDIALGLLRNGIAEYNPSTGLLRIDTDRDGTYDAGALLGPDANLGIDDVIIF